MFAQENRYSVNIARIIGLSQKYQGTLNLVGLGLNPAPFATKILCSKIGVIILPDVKEESPEPKYRRIINPEAIEETTAPMRRDLAKIVPIICGSLLNQIRITR